MRFVISRVNAAAVEVESKVVGSIRKGVSILVGINREDTQADMESLARKLLTCRFWPDENDRPHMKTIKDMDFEILLISQFTLCHKMKGTKPDFHNAMKAEDANSMFLALRDLLSKEYSPEKVQTGQFQAYQIIKQELDGPFTLYWDSKVKEQ